MTIEKRLNQLTIRNAQPKEKPYRLPDGGGLFLHVQPSGSKLWRYKFRFASREQLLSLGKYPDVSLSDARIKHAEARQLLADGINPCAQRREDKRLIRLASLQTVEAVSTAWLSVHSKKVIESRIRSLETCLRLHCIPFIGARAVDELRPKDLLQWLRELEEGGVGLATIHQTRSALKMALDYAIAEGIIEMNPLAGGIVSRQLAAHRPVHMPAPKSPEDVGEVLRAIDAAPESLSIQARVFMKLLPMLVTRPRELSQMRWADLDFAAKEWRFTASKTKTQMIVPLSRQAVEILRFIEPVTGVSAFVFNSPKKTGKPIYIESIAHVMRGLDLREGAVSHGWRSVFSTLGREVLGFQDAWIEMQLGHRVAGPLGATYNRAQWLEQRREMMQRWADYLDELRAPA